MIVKATVSHRPKNMPANTRLKSLAPRTSPYRVVPQFGHSRKNMNAGMSSIVGPSGPKPIADVV